MVSAAWLPEMEARYAGAARQASHHAAQVGQHLPDAGHLARLVASLRFTVGALLCRFVQPVRRHIGRIGLQHDGLQRQGRGETAQLLGALIGQGTTKAELEPQLNEFKRLLLTAIKRMGNAMPG
jgi:hypothetical protein